MANHHVELFQRSEHNPILTAADWPYPVNSVFNPGATLLPDGTTLLLCRVEDRRGQVAVGEDIVGRERVRDISNQRRAGHAHLVNRFSDWPRRIVSAATMGQQSTDPGRH